MFSTKLSAKISTLAVFAGLVAALPAGAALTAGHGAAPVSRAAAAVQQADDDTPWG